MTLHRSMLIPLALTLLGAAPADPPVRRVPDAAAWRQTLDLVPTRAISLVAMPNPRLAADDLAECLAGAGQGEAALPMRPIDLFKSRLGLGGGIDESGAFVMWFQMQEGKAVPAMLVPVTDAQTFLQANFEKVETPEGVVHRHPELGSLHARTLDRRVLLSTDRRLVDAYAISTGMSAWLQSHLGERGFSVLTGGDLAAWAGPEATADARRQGAAMRRATGAGQASEDPSRRRPARSRRAAAGAPPAGNELRGDIDGSGEVDSGDMGALLIDMGRKGGRADLDGDGTVTQEDVKQMQQILDKGPAAAPPAAEPEPAPSGPATGDSDSDEPIDPADGLLDGVLSVDFDPLGVSTRSFAIMDPAKPLGRATRGGPAADAVGLSHLPKGPVVLAASVDPSGLGGVEALEELRPMAPEAPAMPEWIMANRQLIRRVEFAIYPSKLGVAGGGLLNEACLWLGTADSARARELLKAWMTGLSGTRDGMETKVVWEEGKTTKDGTVADAWSVVEQPVAGGRARPNPMRRMAQSLVFGPRGATGFVKTFPDGMLITFSQRPDVLKRCVETIEGGPSLESSPAIAALRAWLLPGPDVEAYVGVGSLLSVVRQAAASFPGGGLELPDAPPNLEPVAFAMQVQDARVETATMVPAGVVGVMAELYRIRTRPTEEPSPAADEAGVREP